MGTSGHVRVNAFDRLRGLIMVVMAIDHASFFIARIHAAETWGAPPPYYADTTAFLTRWITHLCAPGFSMLMGIGLVWFAESRMASGWTAGRISRFFVTRGALLLLIQHFIENPAWIMGILSVDPAVGELMPGVPGVEGNTMLGFAVLSALGIALIFWGLCWRLPTWAIGVVCLTAMVLTRLVVPNVSAADRAIPLWQLLLFVPGTGGIVQNMYPWVIWLVPAGLGIAVGRVFRRDPTRIVSISGRLALAGIASFVVMRVTGLGEYHEPAAGVIGWLTVTKYPPSEAFFALMLGLDFALIAALAAWPSPRLAPLEVYGRVPFFFYIAHMWAFGLLSWGFASGTSWPVMYLVWALVMVALYPACAWYARFKFSNPETSRWRMF